MTKTKFRERISGSGNTILSGKDSKSNEKLITQVEPEEDVFHTQEKGSPFVNLKGKPARGDIKEAAIFCAIYSQDWKKNCGDVIVHRFKGKNVFKDKKMKVGTFGVKNFKRIKVKKEWIEGFEL
jgi:predicted ribosome quality control (RQC) complex YloA/Tae2 family protein